MNEELYDDFLEAAERCPHLFAVAASRIDSGSTRPAYPDYREWAVLLAPPTASSRAAEPPRGAVGFPEPFSACWTVADGWHWQCGFHNGEPIEVPSGMGLRERMDWETSTRRQRYEALAAGREEFNRLASRAAALYKLSTAKPDEWPPNLPWPKDEAGVLAWLSLLIEERLFDRVHGFHTIRFENIFAASAATIEALGEPPSQEMSYQTTHASAGNGSNSGAPSTDGASSNDWRNQPIPAWLLQSMVLLHDNPEMTDEQVARKVKTPVSTLIDDPRYREVAEKARRPVAPQSRASEPQPGDPIPGSNFFVEVCSVCGERIRVPRSQVGTEPVCSNCSE